MHQQMTVMSFCNQNRSIPVSGYESSKGQKFWNRNENREDEEDCCRPLAVDNGELKMFVDAFSLTTPLDLFLDPIGTWDKKMDCVQHLAALSTVVGQRQSSTTLPRAEAAPKEELGYALVLVSRSD
ncbi:hypothetical protein AVEN_226466-1 [Araneus ventricosus]|uniref:Uncharacterized protein n=1 Tax=Araneus ventricosus TaxID=182803 RepID=A0A4Y2V001_ARAVE|nr:hypothetical protein AVEN_226466-1 [Araneus ventricosus]